jgi:hypothetical protein
MAGTDPPCRLIQEADSLTTRPSSEKDGRVFLFLVTDI